VLVRFDDLASLVVNANHGIMRAAVLLRALLRPSIAASAASRNSISKGDNFT
jgi:hypothetical protein